MSDEKHPLEIKFASTLRKPPVKKRKTTDLLSDIENHEGVMKLFHLLEKVPNYGKLLSLHPLDLFGQEGRFRTLYLYHGMCVDAKKRIQLISKALEELQIHQKVQASHGTSKLLEKIGISNIEQESLGRDFIDAAVYVLVILFRNSTRLKELINMDEFDYKKLRATMKDYTDVLDEKELENIISSIFGEEPSDPEMIDLIERLILGFVPLISGGTIELLELTKTSQTELEFAYHQSALSFLQSLISKVSISSDDYTELLDQLYLYNLIENGHTIFWCENCSKERTNYYQFHGSMVPSKMKGRKCRECKQIESFSSMFTVDALLLEIIFSVDHFLGVYLAWKFNEEGLDLTLNSFAGDKEIDVIVNSKLVEVKTFRIGGRAETFRENLEQTIFQIKQQAEALASTGKSIDEAFILWNQPELNIAQLQISSKVESIVNQYNIQVLSFLQIKELIEQIK